MGNVVRQEFQRDVSAEAGVLGFIHDAHASAAQFFQDAVVGNRAANNRGGVRHRRWIVRQRIRAGNRDAASAVLELRQMAKPIDKSSYNQRSQNEIGGDNPNSRHLSENQCSITAFIGS